MGKDGQDASCPGIFKMMGWALFVCALGLTASCAGFPKKSPECEPARVPAVFRFYQAVVSPVDGDRCHMRPSCSSYTAEAVVKHGWFLGWILGCDRLIRCGGDEANVSAILVEGEERVVEDPLSANDFWWAGSREGMDH